MKKKELTWLEAIQEVLGNATGPMNATQITEEIFARNLKSTVGATPTSTVAALLYTSAKKPDSPYESLGKGVFRLKFGPITAQPTAMSAARSEPENTELTDETGALQAYGMFWNRDAVMWNAREKRLLGRQTPKAESVNFADQIGVYLLHDRDRTIYVGRAAASLFARLFAHTQDRLASRWDRFSWFGLKTVSERGQLGDPATIWSSDVVINTFEALLIESLEPPLNRKQGDGFAAIEYLQAPDPEIEAAEEEAIINRMKQRIRPTV